MKGNSNWRLARAARLVADGREFRLWRRDAGQQQARWSESKHGDIASVAGETVLTLSDDFTPPAAPDVHWMVVESSGATYVLDRLMVKPDRLEFDQFP
jgi:hypothetical protein